MEDYIEKRECGFEDVEHLYWVKGDKGGFGNESDGPLFDWIVCKSKIFEHVNNWNTVIQAGGCCGMYATFYSKYFDNVYTFEPDTKNYSCLKLNVPDNVHHWNAALGQSGDLKASFKAPSASNVGTGKIQEWGPDTGDVDVMYIDQLNLQSCDLIHLDIEGGEDRALKGALETINKFKPVIVMEKGHGASQITPIGYKEVLKMRMDHIYVWNG